MGSRGDRGPRPNSSSPSQYPPSQYPPEGAPAPLRPDGGDRHPSRASHYHSSGSRPSGRPGSNPGSPSPGQRPRNGDMRPRSQQGAPAAVPSPIPGYNMQPPGDRYGPPGGPPPPGSMDGRFPPGGPPPGTAYPPQAPTPGMYSAPPPMEPVGPVRSVEHKAAMEEGYAPATFNAHKDGKNTQDEDADPVLKELNDTWPNLVASIVARSPGLCMLLMFIVLLACAAPAFVPVLAPEPLTDFDSLQIKDHPAAAKRFTVQTLTREDTFFKKRKDVAPEDDTPEDGTPAARRLQQLPSARGGPDVFVETLDAGEVSAMQEAWRGLGSASVVQPFNQEEAGRRHLTDILGGLPGGGEDCEVDDRSLGEEKFLAIFYRYRVEDDEEPRNAITQEMVDKAREVEDRIRAFPEFNDICDRNCSGGCAQALSFATFVYTSRESYLTGNIVLEDEPVWEPQQAGEFLVSNNFTFFFNIDSNGTYAIWLRTIIPFREENGLKPPNRPYRDILTPKLITMFEDVQTDDIVINYGEDHINTVQINRQIFYDLRWAALSVCLAGIMLRVGSGSNFMTIVGIFQIIISFPISWLVYSAPKGWKFINFIHFLAPFVMLGIGLDDIFVSIAFFQNTRPFMGYFALDTRLTAAFSQAASAMLATSTTSAFAFAANIFSPVPAIQSFGLLLATLVIINYILAVTWLPVCLAVWDKHFEFPRRAAEARGHGGACTCTLCGCGGCCQSSRAPSMGQTLRIIKGGQEPRALEFMQVVLPFWRTMRVTEQIKHHRLLHPDRPPIIISRDELAHVHQQNAYKIFGRTIDVRRIIGSIFDFVFKWRWITISLCLVASLIGMAGTIALEPPPTSEPPIFESDHNVQFFYRYTTSNESDNLPTCPACLRSTMDTWTQLQDGGSNINDFFDTSQPLIGFEQGGFSTVVSDIIWGVAEGGIDNRPNADDGDPAGAPVFNKLIFDDQNFDVSTAAGQQLIDDQLLHLQEYTTPTDQRSLFTAVEYNPLDKLREFCNPQDAEEEFASDPDNRGLFCEPADGVNGLPTGSTFRLLAYNLLATKDDVTLRDYMGYRRQEDSGQSAFDFIDCFQDIIDGIGCDDADNFPRIDWVRVKVRTTTARNEPPEVIEKAFDDWGLWSNSSQQDSEYRGQFAASGDWVTAVTYKKISDSVYGTVFLSIGLAAAVVFVFCGPLMMLLAAITVLMINLTVMGVLYVWDWDLGSVEAMSITSLVGLSVDFCIHMSEAFNHAQATWAPDADTAAKSAFQQYFSSQPKGREKALVLVAVPMVASAFSTVITTTPLFAAATLILKRFAAVIFITMLVGLVYVVLFLTPMLAMFGPGVKKKREITEDTPLHEVVTDMLLKSKGVRFVGMAVLAVLILLAIPSTQQRLSSGGTLRELMVMLLAAALVALCGFILAAFVRASFHKKKHLQDHERHRQEQLQQLQQRMARPGYVPQPAI